MLKLYNTLTRKKQIFKPLKNNLVRIYSCGPTVYDYDHLGHAWRYLSDDILRRVLEYNGYKVKHVMNITDVGHLTSDSDTGEDKMEKTAQEQKKTAHEIADYYTKIFFEHRKKMKMLVPNIICKASGHIKEMIDLIKILEKKGYAYKTSDGIYFNVKKFPKYGKLSGNTLDKLKAGARIEINKEKKHPADFALWKFSPKNKKRQMEWLSPWGIGFPGWHLECSAMSMKYLGSSFDIHTGGEDNIFPHHECEIAQSEAATGKKFVNFWLHARFLTIENQKMSKSLKNFYRLEDIEKKGFAPMALRYLFLTSHYSSKMNFTWQGLEASQNVLNKLYEAMADYKKAKRICFESEKKFPRAKIMENKFFEAVNDDLNTPKALGIVWNLIKSDCPDSIKKSCLLKFDKILGLGLDKIKPRKIKISAPIKKLLQEREKARKEKNWQKSDEIRNNLKENGYLVEDSLQGQKISKIKKLF
ncbi:MAG: cysteinyl-tRNA synthetase [Parcubacteria group bacterium Athens1014_10]|nr:MAG: cysteinyl-tRNA synthetase [Parcubacteria group bacterium Athens1014_10]TSD04625.1 MAG: cysteinyl-tRNA synthetase [Parcubacteria group bacterium Athens0714_12]